MSVLSAASIAPVKGTQDQVLKSVRTITPGVVGAARNVKMSISAPSASATLTADQIVLGVALSGQLFRLSGFNKTINLATVGAGGMDTGAAPTSGSVAIYAIYNPTTGVSALLARNSTSGPAPEIYGGANMPAGFTASALVSSWRTNPAGLLVIGEQTDRTVNITTVSPLSTAVQQVSYTSLSISGSVPSNAKTISGVLAVGSSTTNSTSTLTLASAASSSGEVQTGISNAPANLNSYTSFSGLVLSVAQTVYYKLFSNGTISIGNIYISGYTF